MQICLANSLTAGSQRFSVAGEDVNGLIRPQRNFGIFNQPLVF